MTTVCKTLKNLNDEIVKNRILDAAEEEFVEKGLYGARVDAISMRSDVNKRIVYLHFESKENLYKEVVSRIYSRMVMLEYEAINSDNPDVETMKDIILFYYKFLSHNPSFVKIVLWENLMHAKYVSDANIYNMKAPVFESMRTILRKGIENGNFRKDIDIEQTILSVNLFCFSSFSNITTMSILMNKDYSTEEEIRLRANHICDVIIKYIENK